jgi:hypothetical protein
MTKLLTDPFLQNPTATTIKVVWFTEFAGCQHLINYGENLNQSAMSGDKPLRVYATTTKLTRTREDQKSRVGNQTEDGQIYQKPSIRHIWRRQ